MWVTLDTLVLLCSARVLFLALVGGPSSRGRTIEDYSMDGYEVKVHLVLKWSNI